MDGGLKLCIRIEVWNLKRRAEDWEYVRDCWMESFDGRGGWRGSKAGIEEWDGTLKFRYWSKVLRGVILLKLIVLI